MPSDLQAPLGAAGLLTRRGAGSAAHGVKRRSGVGSLFLVALLCGGIAPALGAAGEDVRSAGLSGVLVVCKEYGTVLGTFLTDVRGRDIARLSFLFGEDVNPRFSPTDDRILFASARGGTPGLWMMNRKGEGQRRICDGDQGDWFPDGRRIAFRRQGRIVARSLEGGEETVVSPAGWQSCSSPACSPDGRRTLIVASGGGKDAICLVTPGESEPRKLAEGEMLGAPRWAPGGGQIAYQSGAHLWMMDADGSNRRQLTTSGGIQRRPAWSPDGTAIAYCQGPGPKGPWQMAMTLIDGTKRFPVPLGDARSVLCSDWGGAKPGEKPEPKGMAVRPPSRIHLWEIDPPVAAAPADWAAFCREREGWNAVPAEKALAQPLRGGCVVENDSAVFLLLAGKARAVLLPKPAARSAVEFALLDPQGKEAGPVESVRVLRCGADDVALESSSRSAGATVKAVWGMGGSRALVQVVPLKNTDKLRVDVPLECVVAPDRFGDDIVADPEALGEGRAPLPWAPLVTGLCGGGADVLVVISPEQGQRMELRKGKGPSFLGADVALGKRGVAAGAVACEQAWHLERFGTERQADPLRFKWRMPCPAAWRLAVQGDAQRCSAFFSDKESAFFDKKDALFRKSKDFAPAVRLGVIYLYDRTAGTPAETLTPVDLVRDALGPKAAQRALDEEGLTGYRRAAGPTTWAELSVTLEALRYLFERQVEVQDSAYAGHLCDDILPFVDGMDQRLKEYADFTREVQVLSRATGKTTAAAAKSLEDLAAAAQKLGELGEKQRGLRSPTELSTFCTKIKQLTAKESGENRKQFEECCRELLAVVGPREEMLRAYRKLAVAVSDAAGSAPLTQADLLSPAEKIMALCRGVLRNRFYAEADWRGEAYDVPAFWFGPRPYE
jgi:Tol biopolymer transport system component